MNVGSLFLSNFYHLCVGNYCYFLFLSSGGVAAHTPQARLAHSRFRPTTEAYSQGKFLTNVAQHRSYPKSAQYGKAGIWTHDPVVGYLVRL